MSCLEEVLGEEMRASVPALPLRVGPAPGHLGGALATPLPSQLSLELVLFSAGSPEFAVVPGLRCHLCTCPRLSGFAQSLSASGCPPGPPPAGASCIPHLTSVSLWAPGSPSEPLFPVRAKGAGQLPQMRAEGRVPPVARQLCPGSPSPRRVFPRQPGGMWSLRWGGISW